MKTAKTLTVTENQMVNGWNVTVYDEADHEFAVLSEIELNMLYFHGILTARFGSYEFKQQVKQFVRGM